MKRLTIKKTTVLVTVLVLGLLISGALYWLLLTKVSRPTLSIDPNDSIQSLYDQLKVTERFSDRRSVWDVIQVRINESDTALEELLTEMRQQPTFESMLWLELLLNHKRAGSRPVKVAEQLRFYNHLTTPKIVAIAQKHSSSTNGYIGIPCGEALFTFGRQSEGLIAILQYGRSRQLRKKVQSRLKRLTGHHFRLDIQASILEIDEQVKEGEQWIEKRFGQAKHLQSKQHEVDGLTLQVSAQALSNAINSKRSKQSVK